MKKLLILSLILFTGCKCILSQIPPQTIYVDENCQGTIPDYTLVVTVSDNCPGVLLSQSPTAGTILDVNTPSADVVVTATDAFNNKTSITIPVILIDTIPPLLEFPIGQANMTEQDIVNLYANWKEAVKIQGIARWVYDQSWTQGLPFADSTAIINSLKIFSHNIVLTDDEYAQYVTLKSQ